MTHTANTETSPGIATQALALPMPLSEVAPGPNTITLTLPDAQMDFANIDLILKGADDIVLPPSQFPSDLSCHSFLS